MIRAVDNGSSASGRIYVCRSDREYLPVICRSEIARCKIIRILVYERNIGVQTRANNSIKGCVAEYVTISRGVTINHVLTMDQKSAPAYSKFLSLKISKRL